MKSTGLVNVRESKLSLFLALSSLLGCSTGCLSFHYYLFYCTVLFFKVIISMATRHYSRQQGWITATVELEISNKDKENGKNRDRAHKNLKAKM